MAENGDRVNRLADIEGDPETPGSAANLALRLDAALQEIAVLQESLRIEREGIFRRDKTIFSYTQTNQEQYYRLRDAEEKVKARRPVPLFVIERMGPGMQRNYWACSTVHGCGWSTHDPKQAFTKSELAVEVARIAGDYPCGDFSIRQLVL